MRREKICLRFQTRLNTDRAVQPHKMSRGLKLRMWRDYILYVLEGLFYTCVYRGTLVSGRSGILLFM